MARKSTIRLLAVTPTDNDAERLVALFRGAGRVARVQRVDCAEDLVKALQKDCDLLVIEDGCPDLDIPHSLAHVVEHDPELPVLILQAGADVPTLSNAGAAAVFEPDDDARFLATALRELRHREVYRELGDLRRQLHEAESRNELLLAEAKDAIAYVTDGMVIHANTVFARRFGCDNPADMDCVPIVDLIAPADHDKIKALFKRAGAGEALESPACGQTLEGETFDITLQLSPAVYDDEACTQLVIRDGAAGEASGAGAAQAGQLEANLNALAATGGGLGYALIDRHSELRERLGLAGSRILREQLAAWLQQCLEGHGHAHACGDDGFALTLPDLTAGDALPLMEDLCRRTGEHIIEAQGQSLQCTLSVGITSVGAGSDTPGEALEQAFLAAAQAQKDGGSQARRPDISRPDGSMPTELDAEQALEEALEAERFVLLFQPMVSLRGASGEHYEVLLRMRDDNGDEIVPDNFLEALANSNARTRLDRWLIMEATKRLAERRADGSDVRLIINLTGQALQDETLPPWLGVVIKAAGVPAQALVWQLTEADVCHNLKQARELSERLRELGCQVSVGRFGRSPDPVKMLRHVGADLVQIDGAFTLELQNKGDPALLTALVSGVRDLSVRVAIPCVENASVLAILWQMGIDYIQGHYLQAPAHNMDYEFSDIA